MKTDDNSAAPTAEAGLASPKPSDCRATFPIDNGIYGVGQLAKRLNALVEKASISTWHLGGWTDWKHRAIRIDFGSPEDARRAADAWSNYVPGRGKAPVEHHGPDERTAAAVTLPTGFETEPPRDERCGGSPDRLGVWENEGGAQGIRGAS